MRRGFFFLSVVTLLCSCTTTRQLSKRTAEGLLKSEALRAAHVGITIFDPAESRYLYNHQGDKCFVPASNVKIPTCYAAMRFLGDSLVGLRYKAAGTTLTIEPAGDPSFLHPDFKQQPAYDLLRSYNSIVIQKPLFESEFLGSGWSWNDYREGYMAQRSNLPVYGNTARITWTNNREVQVVPSYFSSVLETGEPLTNGFTVEKPWEENRFVLMAGSTKVQEVPFRPTVGTLRALLFDTLKRPIEVDIFSEKRPAGILYSQPTDSLLKPMMHRSDNFFAEQSLLMVANEYLGIMNEQKLIDTLLKTALSDLPQKPRWVDGSGLSRYNLFTPQDLVMLLNKIKSEFGMARVKTVFATGNEGALTNYFKEQGGRIFAKTGTLSGVVALSGFLYTDKNRLLLFSVLVNNHQNTATKVRREVEAYLAALQKSL